MSDLLFFVAISLVLFGMLFGIAAVTAAERRTHDRMTRPALTSADHPE